MNQVRKVISTRWLVIWTVTWFTQLAGPVNHLKNRVIRRLAAVWRSAKYPSVVAFCYMWEDLITTRQWPQYRVPRCFNYVFNSVIASRELCLLQLTKFTLPTHRAKQSKHLGTRSPSLLRKFGAKGSHVQKKTFAFSKILANLHKHRWKESTFKWVNLPKLALVC